MVSKVEPDRYADTGYSVNDTPPEVNARLFRLMMERTPAERLKMGLSMTATAKTLVWASLSGSLNEAEREATFLQRFYGEEVASFMTGLTVVDVSDNSHDTKVNECTSDR